MRQNVSWWRGSQATAPDQIRRKARQLWQWEGCPAGDVSRYIEMAAALVQAEVQQGYGRQRSITPTGADESLRRAASMIRNWLPN